MDKQKFSSVKSVKSKLWFAAERSTTRAAVAVLCTYLLCVCFFAGWPNIYGYNTGSDSRAINITIQKT